MQETGKIRALIADDSNSSRILFKKVLESLNCVLIGEAVSGSEALMLFNNMKPDLLLLDILMPEKRGTEVLKEIIASDPQANVVMLSSIYDEDIVNKCLEMGAKGFLQKNAPMSEIKSVISGIIQSIGR